MGSADAFQQQTCANRKYPRGCTCVPVERNHSGKKLKTKRNGKISGGRHSPDSTSKWMYCNSTGQYPQGGLASSMCWCKPSSVSPEEQLIKKYEWMGPVFLFFQEYLSGREICSEKRLLTTLGRVAVRFFRQGVPIRWVVSLRCFSSCWSRIWLWSDSPWHDCNPTAQ